MTVKTRLLIAIPLIILMGALVAAGFSMAWFGDAELPSSVSYTLGTVELDITDVQTTLERVNDEFLWDADEPTAEFTWTLKNAGTKSAFLRARLIEEFEFILAESDSATAAEADTYHEDGRHKYIFDKHAWFTYFKYTMGEDETAVFVVGSKHDHVGEVDLEVVEGELRVVITLDEGYYMREAHLHIDADIEEFLNPAGNPAPGQFDWKSGDIQPPEASYTFSVPVADSDLGTRVYVAVHASLMEVLSYEEGDSPVTWELTDGCPYEWRLGDDGWWYYCSPGGVPAGEEVTLCLTGTLGDEVRVGAYRVEVEAEVLQASSEALEHEWPYAPCNEE